MVIYKMLIKGGRCVRWLCREVRRRVRKRTDGRTWERRWLMGNISPLDGNVVSAVTNKRREQSDGAAERGEVRVPAWMLAFRGC